VVEDNEEPPYDSRDRGIIADNIFNELCKRDKEDRKASREPRWHDMTELADKLRAFDDRTAAAYSAEVDLLDKKQFIERSYNNVRLTKLGRENCDKGIDIPPSDRQVIRQVEKQNNG
jgi:hypothetical protein